jgi:hypothetical protein
MKTALEATVQRSLHNETSNRAELSVLIGQRRGPQPRAAARRD